MDREFRFVHAADLHLGARRWLDGVPDDVELRERIAHADQLALTALIDACIATDARLLLCAGDIVDGWCRDYRVGLWLVHELERLAPGGCEVVLLYGNHDARTRVLRPLLLPELVHVLGVRGPETRIVEHLGVALHGWSCPEVDVGCDVAALYPRPVPGLLNVGLLHTSAQGQRGHVDYAPCSRRTLRRAGYDYWALGHVHRREVLCEAPWIVFPGNLQARGFREMGDKGATVVTVKAGRIVSVVHRELSAVRFSAIDVTVEDARRFGDVVDAVRREVAAYAAECLSRPTVAMVQVAGPGAAACALSVPERARTRALRRAAREATGPGLWVEGVWIDAGAWGAGVWVALGQGKAAA